LSRHRAKRNAGLRDERLAAALDEYAQDNGDPALG
jgi:hypothetical protein